MRAAFSRDEDFDLVAALEVHGAVEARHFRHRQKAFRLVADVDDDVARRDLHYAAFDDLTLCKHRRLAIEVEKLVHAEVLQIVGVRLTRLLVLLVLVIGRHELGISLRIDSRGRACADAD
jgi:hypothetical protein